MGVEGGGIVVKQVLDVDTAYWYKQSVVHEVPKALLDYRLVVVFSMCHVYGWDCIVECSGNLRTIFVDFWSLDKILYTNICTSKH